MCPTRLCCFGPWWFYLLGDFFSDWHHAEKQRLEESVHDLKLQRDKYLEEVNKAFIYLTGEDNDLLPLKLVHSLPDQMAHMVKIMAIKDQALTSV